MANASPEDGPNETNEIGLIDWSAALVNNRSWLRAVVLARVGDPHAADDVLQEVSLAATKQREQLDDATRIKPWLYRVAVRQALLYRRKAGRLRKRQAEIRDRSASASSDTEATDPLDWLLKRERSELVQGALRQLDDRDVEVLMLKYAEDWNYRQIADNLGVSASAVESRLHRARRKLRRALASKVQ